MDTLRPAAVAVTVACVMEPPKTAGFGVIKPVVETAAAVGSEIVQLTGTPSTAPPPASVAVSDICEFVLNPVGPATNVTADGCTVSDATADNGTTVTKVDPLTPSTVEKSWRYLVSRR